MREQNMSDDTQEIPQSWTQALSRCQKKALRKQAYWNILKILSPKNEDSQMKNTDISRISPQNIDRGYSLEPPRRGGSSEYPQSIFWAEKKKDTVYPCKPQFYHIKVGFKGFKII